MYGLRKDFDTSFLLGKKLELICLSENTVNFHFNDGLSFTIESAYSHQTPGSKGADEPIQVPALSSNIDELLGSSVTDVLANEDGTLILKFANQHQLKFFDTSPQYESYKINYKDVTVIV
jgi:hypothetical protein